MTVDVQRIRSIPLFADFTETQYAAVAEKLEERAAATGAH
jgi:hypothetical protein